MANYYETMVSNDFATKNNAEVTKVLECTYGIEEVWNNSNNTICFGNYTDDSCLALDTAYVLFKKENHEFVGVYDEEIDEIENILSSEDVEKYEGLSYEETQEQIQKDYDTIGLVEYLQDMLLDGELILITTIGNEKLRYVGGGITFISKNTYEYKDLRHVAEEMVRAEGLDVSKV